MKTIAIASGYFNPIHIGHLKYLELSKKLGDELMVIVNNDLQVRMKGSTPFQNEKERLEIISSLKIVDQSVLSIDKDRSVIETIKKIHTEKGNNNIRFVFCNGGDQNNDSIAERNICMTLGIDLKDNLGEKIQSSSNLKRTKRIIVDIDNTITVEDSNVDYENKVPRKDVIKKLGEYQENGFEIILFTARNMKTYNGDLSKINKFTISKIQNWLKKHSVSYDGLMVGKPWCGEDGFYLDDKAIRPSEFLKLEYDEIKKLIE